MKNTLSHWLGVAFLTVFVLAFVGLHIQQPEYNWDMIGYVASARADQYDDPGRLQEDVYSELQDSVPASVYQNLTEGPHREIRAKDPDSLMQHLPFYQIRILFVETLKVLEKLGVNIFAATHWVSTVCVAISIVVLAFLFPRNDARIPFMLCVPFICLSVGFSSLARLSTPDSMSMLFIIGCYWLLFRRNAFVLCLLPLCVLVRTDSVLLLPFFYIYLLIIRAFPRWCVVASAVSAVAFFVGVNAYFNNYGWATVFDYTFLNRSTHPADYEHTVTLAGYLSVLKKATIAAYRDYSVHLFLAANLGVAFGHRLAMSRIGERCEQWDLWFTWGSSLAYVICHFMLFPRMWERFFAGQYALALALLFYLFLAAARRMENQVPPKAASIRTNGLSTAFQH